MEIALSLLWLPTKHVYTPRPFSLLRKSNGYITSSPSPLYPLTRRVRRRSRSRSFDPLDNMEMCRATALSWTNHFAAPFPHIPQTPPSIYVGKRIRVMCSSSETGSDQSSKANQMVVSITGATGFIGRRLVRRLIADNHSIRVLTRSRSKAQLVFPVKDFPGITIVEEPEWNKCIQGSTAVVNLAGMPISTRWSYEIKKEIKRSRINTTSKVVDIINQSRDDVRPRVLVSATAIGYYGASETQVFDEHSPSGNDYLSEVCREWEARALEVNKNVRLVLIRIGVVLGKDGGALAKMIPLFMMFAGGPLGTGNQWFSWIHLDDLVNLICEALSNPSYRVVRILKKPAIWAGWSTGVINGTAPNPVRLAEMCEHLGQVMGRPSWLPVPDFALKAVLGEGASIVLDGQRVLPVKAKELGFSFRYPFVKEALRAIISEKPS